MVRERKLKLAFAESCTGGLLSSELTEIPGVSDFYMGSVVAYAYDVKCDLLGVSRNALEKEGAVSEIIARQMAQGVRNKLKSDWSVAITGVAGPTGGTQEKPVGTVWFAVAGPNFVSAEKKNFSGTRKEIQQLSVEFAVKFLTESINNNH